ncbi:mono/diheme cytochrome c family protein [Flavobacterium gossypii]|uniref:Cytochrome c6 n=2 Tax=Flavobacterium TaxID=237 RepID=A0A495LYC0_9FLAO|nr:MULTISPECIES: cytochrome c [Flavobacterium]MBA9071935.1 mono/diheme cytochrome c family protein [Flavobacterium gossypii]RKS17860.1 cytochrome c6 [Flavobacterium endophyticum]WDO12434.1 cytochrome c [Flavobacterium sp. WW92]
MKTFLYLGFLLLTTNITTAQNAASGKNIFEAKCQRCHGNDGTKGLFGAKNLQTSRLENTELTAIISKGRRGMPRWEKKLSQTEIESVAAYIKSLRK